MFSIHIYSFYCAPLVKKKTKMVEGGLKVYIPFDWQWDISTIK